MLVCFLTIFAADESLDCILMSVNYSEAAVGSFWVAYK